MTVATVERHKHNDSELIVEQGMPDAAMQTIAALATPVGFGGVAIVRVSGTQSVVLNVAKKILKTIPKPRYAYYGNFYEVLSESEQSILDRGIALYFNAPNSYTGEHVLELHCHGGPVVVDRILAEIIKLDVKLAEPGEFTKRAWLNGKMDLAQVEAVSDLINATSVAAAKSAANTLVGDFSKIINTFLLELIYLRTYVEAAIDFSDEYIDFIKDGDVINKLANLKARVASIIAQTKQGVILQEGINIVISGEPNVGKSSLLNALCRKEEAIVTNIPGTTRDIIKTNLNIKGVPVNLIDTAGLRQTTDLVEMEGIKRAYQNIASADFILLVLDCSADQHSELLQQVQSGSIDLNQIVQKSLNAHILAGEDLKLELAKIILVLNKVDKLESDFACSKPASDEIKNTAVKHNLNQHHVFISAKNNVGIKDLEDLILKKIGFTQTNEGQFIARRRHLESLRNVEQALNIADQLLQQGNTQELIAEELGLAQRYLGEITGEYTPDDLLGSIFASFCIGK